MRRAGGGCSCLGGDAAGGQVPFGEQAQGWDGSVVIVGFHLGGGWGLVAGQVIKAAADGDKTEAPGQLVSDEEIETHGEQQPELSPLGGQ